MWSYYQANWIDLRPSTQSKLMGGIAEHTTTGLLSRLAHPWMLAVPALDHHDRTKQDREYAQKSNFDTWLGETGPKQTNNTSHQLQSKLGCLGICSRPRGNTICRENYTSDITFVSAHCDLDITTSSGGILYSPVTELLISEAAGTTTPAQIKTLDVATDTLLLNISTGIPERNGTWQPPYTAPVSVATFASAHQ
jgi:hypothetical protein